MNLVGKIPLCQSEAALKQGEQRALIPTFLGFKTLRSHILTVILSVKSGMGALIYGMDGTRMGILSGLFAPTPV